MYKLTLWMFFIPFILWAQEIENFEVSQSKIKTNEKNYQVASVSPDDGKNFLIEFGGGFKYWRGSPVSINDNSSKFAINLGFGAYLEGTQRSILGLEFISYRNVIDNKEFYVDLYYRRNFRLSKRIEFFPQIGFSPGFSSNHELSFSLLAGMKYLLSNWEFFVKNQFRFNSESSRASINFLIIGLAVKF